VSRFLLAYEGA